MEMNVDRAKFTALTAVVSALLASHQDKNRLLAAFDLFAEASRNLVLHSPDFTESLREAHDETLQLFKGSINTINAP